MKQLFIIRGLPGSGKTTLAHQISDTVCEADTYFYKDGVYQYNREKIADAHAWCQNSVKDEMARGTSPIAVSNTFVRRWEMSTYYHIAVIYDYQVTEITMSGPLHQNIHGVPDETIERMRSQWEK